MIFAVVDFLAYLAERGRYSPDALAARGWRPVTSETLAAAEDAPPATILVIHPRRSILSWVVMYGTNSVASHTAIYLGGGYVCDATIQGVMIRPLRDVLNERSWFVDSREEPIPAETRAGIVETAVKSVGTPYDWVATVLIGLMEATGAQGHTHPRLWADTALLLSLPALIVRARSRWVNAALVAPAVTYVCLLANERIARWAARRVDKLVDREINRRAGLVVSKGRRALRAAVLRSANRAPRAAPTPSAG